MTSLASNVTQYRGKKALGLCGFSLMLTLSWPSLAQQSASVKASLVELSPPGQALTQGFNHVGLAVTDLDASTAFFTQALGWKKVGGDADYPANFVSDGKMFLTLWQVRDPSSAVAFDRKNNVGLHHLAITVPSFSALDEVHQRLQQVPGVVIEFAPELAYGGPGKHMMVREPSGNRLEFTHRPAKKN